MHAGAGARGGVRRTAGQGIGQTDEATKRLDAERRSREHLATVVDWTKRNLPDELVTYAVMAFIAEKGRRRRIPTVDEVLDRLRLEGRDRATIEKTDPLLLECSTWGEYQQKKARAGQ